MEGLWGFKLHTTCIKCLYRAKGKEQYREPEKWLIRRDIVGLKPRNTNNY